jgi:RHS repeat-associated protein
MTAPAGAQTYYHYDALGSTRNLSGDTGAVLASYTYGAFGNLRLMKGSSDNTLKFTGEQTDDETGLIYLRARYYDPEVGRFVTKDPFPGFDNDVQSINRYVYVQNNPANLDDPSGKLPNLLFAALGGVAGGTIKAGLYIAEQKIIRHEEVNWRVASGKFASGAFTGATAGFTMGGSLIATGAVKGVISYGIEQVVSGEQATLKEAVASGIIGGVTGGLIGGIERMSGLRIPIFDPHAVPGQLSLFDNTIVVTSREYAKYRIAEILAKTGIQLTLEQIRDAFFIQTRGGLVRPAYTSDLAPHLLPQIDSPVILAPSGGK